MSEPQLQNYRKYVQRIRKFRLFGAVLHDSTIPASVSYSMAFISASLAICMICCILNFVRLHLKNLNAITGCMSICCSLIGIVVKIICFALHRPQLIELEDTLQELFREELAKNSETRTVVLSLLHTFDKPAYLYFFFVGGTLGSYIFIPLISIIIQHAKHVDPVKYSLIYPAKFPWSFEDGSFTYQVHFIYETCVTWFLYFATSGGDTCFGYYIFHIASLLRSLTFKLKGSQLEENPRELLLSCVRQHRKLLRCRNLLQDICGPIILYCIVTNAVIMCALIFQATQFQHMSVGKASLVGFYIFVKVTQTFMYAWYGGIVMTEGENFRSGLYYCNWLAKNGKSLKTELIITMLQKPMAVTASGFFYVSVDMFIKVLNTTMSYFFLLQTLDESG